MLDRFCARCGRNGTFDDFAGQANVEYAKLLSQCARTDILVMDDRLWHHCRIRHDATKRRFQKERVGAVNP